MQRREFITVLGGAAATWPLAALAQQPDHMRRIGVLMAHAESDPEFQAYVTAFREGLQKLGWTAELDTVIAAQAREPNGGLIVMPDGFLNVHRAEVILLAARNGLPAVYPWRFFAEQGGLLSYGSEQRGLFRIAASYVDRILKGEKPADLPVQAPTEYELVINLKTAKALGLTVPPTLLDRADKLIE